MSDSSVPIHLSVVVPAFNEEKRIGPTVRRILQYLDERPFRSELLIVLDGSQDRTHDVILEETSLRSDVSVLDNRRNRGKGYTLRRGVLQSLGERVLFSDADLSTPIEDVEKLFLALEEGADVAIGSRALAESNVALRQPWWRETMGRTFNVFVRSLALPGIRDSQCGFKCFRGSVARRLFADLRVEGFAFDVELLCRARGLGFRIAEVPVTWINSPESKVSPVRDSSRMFRDLVRIGWRRLRGHYRRRGESSSPDRPEGQNEVASRGK